MSTSALIHDGPRTHQSLATNEILASKVPLGEKGTRSSRSTHLPGLVALLAERRISGPWHLRERNLTASGSYRASGGFFDIFDDAYGIVTHSVYRRVSALCDTPVRKIADRANNAEYSKGDPTLNYFNEKSML